MSTPPSVPLCVIRFGLGNKIKPHSLHFTVTKQLQGLRLPKRNLWKIAWRDKTFLQIKFMLDQKVLVRAYTGVLVCDLIKNSIWQGRMLSACEGGVGRYFLLFWCQGIFGRGWSLSKTCWWGNTAVWNECPREMKSILLAALNTLSILRSSLNH